MRLALYLAVAGAILLAGGLAFVEPLSDCSRMWECSAFIGPDGVTSEAEQQAAIDAARLACDLDRLYSTGWRGAVNSLLDAR